MSDGRALPPTPPARSAPSEPTAAEPAPDSPPGEYKRALRRVSLLGAAALIVGRVVATPLAKYGLAAFLGLLVVSELARRPEVALALLLFFLPVFDIFPPDMLPLRGVNFHTIVIILVTFGAVRLNRLRPGSTPYSGLFFGLLALAAVGIIQGVLIEHRDFDESFAEAKNWLGFMPFFFLSAAASRTPWGRRMVIWPLILSCMLVSLHASFNYIAAGSSRYRAAGLVGQQPNDFGAYLALMLPIMVSLAVNGTGRLWSRGLAAGGAFLTGMALIFSQSRGAWLAFAAALLAMILVRRYVKLAAVVLIVALFSSSLLPPEFFDRLEETYASPEAEKTETGLDPSAQSRVTQWKAFPVLLAKRPILGHGLWTFPMVIYREGLYHRKISPHSSIIRFGVELGLVGLAFYFIFLGRLILGARTASAQGRDLFETSLYAGIMGSMVALVIADASGARFFRGEIFGIFCALAGLVSGWISEQESRTAPNRPKPSRSGRGPAFPTRGREARASSSEVPASGARRPTPRDAGRGARSAPGRPGRRRA